MNLQTCARLLLFLLGFLAWGEAKPQQLLELPPGPPAVVKHTDGNSLRFPGKKIDYGVVKPGVYQLKLWMENLGPEPLQLERLKCTGGNLGVEWKPTRISVGERLEFLGSIDLSRYKGHHLRGVILYFEGLEGPVVLPLRFEVKYGQDPSEQEAKDPCPSLSFLQDSVILEPYLIGTAPYAKVQVRNEGKADYPGLGNSWQQTQIRGGYFAQVEGSPIKAGETAEWVVLGRPSGNLEPGPKQGYFTVDLPGCDLLDTLMVQTLVEDPPQPDISYAFAQKRLDRGMVEQGELVRYAFCFRNTGLVPILLQNVKSSCGCVVPSWEKGPIYPGEWSRIKAVFTTRGRVGYQSKSLTVLFGPGTEREVLFMKAQVVPPSEESRPEKEALLEAARKDWEEQNQRDCGSGDTSGSVVADEGGRSIGPWSGKDKSDFESWLDGQVRWDILTGLEGPGELEIRLWQGKSGRVEGVQFAGDAPKRLQVELSRILLYQTVVPGVSDPREYKFKFRYGGPGVH